MIQSLKQIKNRIKSIENTRKVTSAMQMVSIAKLNRVEKQLAGAKPYFQRLDSLLSHLIADMGDTKNSFLEERAKKEKIALCVVTSDSGLCGMYNNVVIRFAEDFIMKQGGGNVKLIVIGKKGYNYFRSKKITIEHSYLGLQGRYSEKTSDEIAQKLMSIYSGRLADEVYITYTKFSAAYMHKPVMMKVLNVCPEQKNVRPVNYILEPGKERILEELVERYIFTKVRFVLLEAFASEHTSRVMAMKTATDNARDLLAQLTLLRNKVRQASITQDIMEIISSADALKG
ncbi:MAG: ATP synthase F1 subunit gamma [Candidatus Omnitrophica bacterium]|nr:ATP synthase F1 subunit gamma [Candidatus Omnitrophota bacterium]